MNNNMKTWLKNLFHKEYRLTVIVGGRYLNFIGKTYRDVVQNAKFGLPYFEQYCWTIYKTGRFFRRERKIDWGGYCEH